MSTIALRRGELAPLFETTAGNSAESTALRNRLKEARNALHRAASSMQSLALLSLEAVLAQSAVPGWDGYEAEAVSEAAAARTRRFLEALPTWLAAPSIVPEPDGEIAIEWDFGPRHIFSISIGARGELHFAGLLGEGRERHGTEPFEGVVASEIIGYILELAERAGRQCRAA